MNYQLLSHPDKPLITHLSEVAQIATDTIKWKSFNFSIIFNNHTDQYIITDLVYLSAAFHDIGKASKFFQEYITNPHKPTDKRKNHALISALFVYFSAEKYFETKNIDNQIAQLLRIFIFLAVKKHHGELVHLENELLIDEHSRSSLKEIAQNIDSLQIQSIIDKLLIKYNFKIQWYDFYQFIENETYNNIFENFCFDTLKNILENTTEQTQISLFYLHHLIYSTLLFADKNEIIVNEQFKILNQTNVIDKIYSFRKNKSFDNPKSEIDKLKNEAFYQTFENLTKKFDINKHIYSITLPTGMGKTILALNLADKMRKLTGFENSKIIINIPFTSIIDQNFEVYREIVQTQNSNILLKHHHLADPVYKIDEEDHDYNQSKFLIETWQSEIIVTTFVQLLETFFNCDKTKIMKFANIANSIVLLDEIQTVPYKLWSTINHTFKIIGQCFNIYFILISATQPLIFNPNEEIIELVPNYKKYFSYFNRTKLEIKGKISFDDFKLVVEQYINSNPQKDVLIILNTKKSALETFKYLCQKLNTNNIEIYFLTTLITPYERKIIINKIKTKSQKQKIIVSTQLVEAGVDFSVDTVFRQIAPLDSIIQSAGRSNRYNEKQEISQVFIYDIEQYKKASSEVYGCDLLIKTENVLNQYSTVEEKNYTQLIEKYFVQIKKQSENITQTILNAIKNLEFGDVNLELIEFTKTESVFVQINEHAKNIWNKFVEIYSNTKLNIWQKEAEFISIKSDFYDFVINVPIPKDKNHIDFADEKQFNFYVSHLENLSQNYHYSQYDFTQNTGYTDNKTTTQFL